MNEFKDYLNKIEEIEQREMMEEVFNWIDEHYPAFEKVIKWNQPMYMDHGTFIIGFSRAKKHMSFTPEEMVISLFSDAIKEAGYEHTKGLAKIQWTQSVDYDLLKNMIDFNIKDKAECTTFFRK